MISRREFLQRSSAAAMAGLVWPERILAGERPARVSANEKINVGLIGMRNMGWGDYCEFFPYPEARCMALCDVNKEILENRAAELAQRTGERPVLYGDYREMLENKEVDAVVIGTPDHWHCRMAIDAMAAGKDVYVEKPLANTIAECDAMVAAAKRYGRVVQVGQQQRSGAIWHAMKKYLDSGKLGNISKVNVWANFNYAIIRSPKPDSAPPSHIDYDMWLGPAPERPYSETRYAGLWRMFWDYGGGLVTDWGVHLLDMALWGMNATTMPKRVMASGANLAYPDNAAETFDTLSVVWEYDNFILQWSNAAGAELGPYDKPYGIEFCGTNGRMVCNREGWVVIPKGNEIEPASFQPDDKDRHNHVGNFLSCIREHRLETACTIGNGSFCAKIAHMGNIAARTKQMLTYDDAKHTFHQKDADKLLRPKYRKPWNFG